MQATNIVMFGIKNTLRVPIFSLGPQCLKTQSSWVVSLFHWSLHAVKSPRKCDSACNHMTCRSGVRGKDQSQ